MSTGEIIVLVTLGVLLIFILLPSFLYVKENEIVIIERFGKYQHSIETPGIYYLIPFIERAVQRVSKNDFYINKKIKKQEGIDQKIIVTYHIKVFDEMLFVYASLDSVKTVHTFLIQTILTKMDHAIALEEIKTYAKQFGFEILEIIYNNK
ncbi:MAG: SPFH domain-containing protein [Acholeplasmataceae bacterium]